ncbi:MAG: glycoside hydrolase family 127 protein [Chloroflexi bacterium]|nr:glycoside hydrolase family 127 protein [Chloroflexota bacterium]
MGTTIWPTIAEAGAITLQGQLDRRLRAAAARLAGDRFFDKTFVLQDVAHKPGYRRQFEEYAGDISGRYIGALAAAAAYTGEQYPRLHAVAHAIPRYQRPTGLVGSDLPLEAVDLPVIWGQGRLLAGLLDYHAAFPSEVVLECARRVGDYYTRSGPTWSAAEARANRDFVYYTQAIEGLVALYLATDQQAYLATAQSIGKLFLQRPGGAHGQHSHGFLLTLLGLLDLYEATGDADFGQAVPPHFTADRSGYTGQGSEAWWCCSNHGLRALSLLPRYLYAVNDDTVRVQFVEPSRVDLLVAGGRVRIVQETSYPGGGETTLRVADAPAGGVRVVVRCPVWAAVVQVRLNGEATGHVVENGYLRTATRLGGGDKLTITLRLGLRVEPGDAGLDSVWWGPLLMTCEIPGGTTYAVAVPPADSAGLIHLPPLDPPDHAYAIAGTHFAVIGTGNPVAQPIDSLAVNQPQLGRLRPLADQTGLSAPPPAVVRMPVVVASGTVLKAELARILRGMSELPED